MQFIYGAKFSQGVVVLRILSWDILLVFVGTVFSQGLIAGHKQKDLSLVMFFMMAACIALNLTLIPVLGISGCAISIIATEVIGIAMQYTRMNKISKVSILRFATKPWRLL